MNSNLLKSKRILNGYTQESISQKVGITPKTYNRKEIGLSTFNIKEIIELSKILELNIQEINEIFFESNLPFV